MKGTPKRARRRRIWPVVAALGLSAVVQVGIVVMPVRARANRQVGVLTEPNGVVWLVERWNAGVFGDTMRATGGRNFVRSGFEHGVSLQDGRSLPEWSSFRGTRGVNVLPEHFEWQTCFIKENAAGWPWRCVRCEKHAIRTVPYGTGRDTLSWTHVGSIRLTDDVRLPYLPIWPGLVLNLVVLALPWYAVFWVAGYGRRVYRRRRGRCGECGYDLAGLERSTACPECGSGDSAA